MHEQFRASIDSSSNLLGANIFPLSAAQRGIWFAQHVAGAAPISIAQYVDISGQLDIDALTAATRQAGREFGTGYLRLVEFDGVPYQVVDETLDDEPALHDFRGDRDPVAAAHAWMDAEYSAPLDLLRDRLVRAELLRIGDERCFLYSRIHHIALDGYAAMTMVQRIAALYNARVNGEQEPPRLADDLLSIVEFDAAYRRSPRFAADGEYWREHLAGLPEVVSLASGRAPVHSHPRRVSAELPAETSALLDALVAASNSSVAVVIVAAFGTYMSRMTGHSDITLSLPVSGRTTASLRRSGGMVANVVPLRVTLDRTTTIGHLVRTAQSELTGALRRQRYRQEDIMRDLGYARDNTASFGPSVNIMAFDARIELGKSVGTLHVLTSGLIEDLFVNLYPGIGGSSTHIDFQANPNMYSDDELRGHHARFLDFLHGFLAAGLDSPQSSLELMTGRERAELVPAWGRQSEPPSTLPTIL